MTTQERLVAVRDATFRELDELKRKHTREQDMIYLKWEKAVKAIEEWDEAHKEETR